MIPQFGKIRRWCVANGHFIRHIYIGAYTCIAAAIRSKTCHVSATTNAPTDSILLHTVIGIVAVALTTIQPAQPTSTSQAHTLLACSLFQSVSDVLPHLLTAFSILGSLLQVLVDSRI